MILVENKFNIGDECYTGYRQPVKYKCPICEGNGVFTHNGYSVKCSNCCGTGNLHNSHQFILVVGKVKINKVVATFDGEEVTVKYKVSAIEANCNIRNRAEITLFKTADEAEEFCRAVNTNQIGSEI